MVAAAQQGLRAPLFLSGRFLSTRQNFLFEGCLVSTLHANVRAPCSIRCALASMRAQFFFVVSGQQLLRMQEFVFICSIRSLLLYWARNIFLGCFCSARAPCCSLFLSVRSLLLTAMHACQGRQRFFSVQSLPVNSSCAHSFFYLFFVTATLYCRVRSLLFL